MKSMTAVVALMAVFSLAMCFIIFGSISTDLMDAKSFSGSQFGTLVMVMFLTSSLVQLIIGPAVDKFGYKPLAIIGFVVTSLSMFLLAFAPSFAVAVLACFLMGIGAMSLNTVGNTLIPVVLFQGKDPARASNFGNAFFGLGYVAMPFLFTLFVKTLGMKFNISLSIFGLLVVIFLVFALMTKFPSVPSGFQLSKAFKLLGSLPILIAALALFCYMSLEVSMGTWIKTLMEEILGKTISDAKAIGFWAGMILSLYGASMMLGRFISSAIKNLTKIGIRVIATMAIVSLIAIVLMMVTKSTALGVVSVFLVGLAFAPIFPTLVGVTFAKYDSSLYGSIFGIMFCIGLLGPTFVPKFIGNMSQDSTIQQSFIIAAVIAAILFIFAILLGFIGKSKKQA
ncbi:MFS transporter [candidate division KSB1 bacterium]|nr:MFS transporter [candidate division KSB1 bacterium]